MAESESEAASWLLFWIGMTHDEPLLLISTRSTADAVELPRTTGHLNPGTGSWYKHQLPGTRDQVQVHTGKIEIYQVQVLVPGRNNMYYRQ